MLYVGNFSYNDDKDQANNYCLMPCVVEADSADEALEKFASKFASVRAESDLLEGASEIYLDSLVELEGVPQDPVITQWQKIVPAIDGLCSVTSELPDTSVDELAASAYGWGEDDGDEIELEDMEELDGLSEDDLEEEGMEEPFLTF